MKLTIESYSKQDKYVYRQAEFANLDSLVNIFLVNIFDAYRIFCYQHSKKEGARTSLQERLGELESVIFLAKRGADTLGFAQLYSTLNPSCL